MLTREEKGRIKSLPRWAQDVIERLDIDLADARERLRATFPGVQPDAEGEQIVIEPYSRYGRAVTLKGDERVRFQFSRDEWVDLYFSDSFTGRRQVCVTASDVLAITPASSNLIYIREVQR